MRGEELEPVELELAVPGRAQPAQRGRRARGARARRRAAATTREPHLVEFAGAGRRLERRGEAGGVAVLDDYAHHPAEVAATIAAVRERRPRARALPAAPLLAHAAPRARVRRRARRGGRRRPSPRSTRAREEPVEGVSGKLVVDALAEARPGMTVGWTPSVEDGARFLARRARPGDVVLTVGAGDVDRAVPLLLEALA